VIDHGRGVREVYRSVFSLLHEREFIGLLRVPVLANMLVFALLIGIGWLGLQPLYASVFATEWWFLDSLRRAHDGHGPALWLAVTWLVLGMPLLEALAGALCEPLHLAAERAMFGKGEAPGARRGAIARLRDRARLCAIALLMWPLTLAIALIPWVGLPFVLLLGAAIAALVWFELPMARRGLDLRARLRLVWRNRWRALGVGAALQVAAAVPPLNLLGLSAIATVAASSAYMQFEKR
jgi:uncharacterized protein involved in cysteine biosynthesis